MTDMEMKVHKDVPFQKLIERLAANGFPIAKSTEGSVTEGLKTISVELDDQHGDYLYSKSLREIVAMTQSACAEARGYVIVSGDGAPGTYVPDDNDKPHPLALVRITIDEPLYWGRKEL